MPLEEFRLHKQFWIENPWGIQEDVTALQAGLALNKLEIAQSFKKSALANVLRPKGIEVDTSKVDNDSIRRGLMAMADCIGQNKKQEPEDV